MMDDVICLMTTLHVVVGIVAAIYAKHVSAIMPHFRDDAAGVGKEFALFFGFPLAAGEYHDGYVLIRFCSPPLRMPQNHDRTMIDLAWITYPFLGCH